MTHVLIALVRFYQVTLSRILRLVARGPICRFEPSCSAYAIAVLGSYGAVRGSLLSVKRLSRCHPFHPGGIDLPPTRPGRAPFPLHPNKTMNAEAAVPTTPIVRGNRS